MTRCLTEIRTYHLPDDEQMRYVLGHGHGLLKSTNLSGKESARIRESIHELAQPVRDVDFQLNITKQHG